MQVVDSYEMSHDDLEAFAKAIADIARSHGMSMATCAEVVDLEKCGIEHNCCIDKKLIEEIIGCDIKVARISPSALSAAAWRAWRLAHTTPV